jgi:hypothetical protein
MKQCKKCSVTKDLVLFNKDKTRKDGYHCYCKECAKESKKEAYSKKKDYYTQKSQAWKKNNPQKVLASAKKGRQKHKARRLADWMHYNTRKLNACPLWLSKEQRTKIENIYKFAKFMEELSLGSIKYHVDHIIPLRGDNVCGLHVPWNLQILNARDNLSKGNRYNG